MERKNPQAVAAQGFSMVTRRGFEPRTHCLKDSQCQSCQPIAAQGLCAFGNLKFATNFASGYLTEQYGATKQSTSWIQSKINNCCLYNGHALNL